VLVRERNRAVYAMEEATDLIDALDPRLRGSV
jgi:hypothetical protein